MSTSQALDPSSSISKQEFYSSLPRWRRWLAILNWRPVVDYELREIEFDRREIEFKQRMKQLDELDSKLDALLCSSSTNSSPHQSTPENSEA